MVNFKTYFTEVTKKDILAGLDANANAIKKAQEYTDKAMALRKHYNDIDRKYPRWSVVKTRYKKDNIENDKLDHIENKKNKHIQEENEKYLMQKIHEQFDHLVANPFPSRDKYIFYTYLTPYILTLDYYYDNFGNIIPLPRESERAKEMINLLFFSVLKYKEVGEYFFDNLKKIDRKYQVGHDADELGEPDDDQEIDEATKKDVLAGLDQLSKKIVVNVDGKQIPVKDDKFFLIKFNFSDDMISWMIKDELEHWGDRFITKDGVFDFDQYYDEWMEFISNEWYDDDADLPPKSEIDIKLRDNLIDLYNIHLRKKKK